MAKVRMWSWDSSQINNGKNGYYEATIKSKEIYAYLSTDISVTYPNATTAKITATVTGYWDYPGASAGAWTLYSPGIGAIVTINGQKLEDKLVFGNDGTWVYHKNNTEYSKAWEYTITRASSDQSISWSAEYYARVDAVDVPYAANVTESGTVNVSALPSYSVSATKGTGISSVSGTGSKQHGSSVTVTATPSTGYHFTSWTYGNNTYTDNPWTITTSITGNISVTANASANTYSVNYDTNGGTTTSVLSATATYDSSFTVLHSSEITRAGYKFLGWTTNTDGTDDGYSWTDWSGSWTFTDGNYGINNGILTLYARWEPLATMHVKVSGRYEPGITFVKVDGEWLQATGVFTKVAGEWQMSVQ